MSYDPGQRQIPILCKNCMGPASPDYDGQILCGYCGHSDKLPADELDRALELKRRVAAAKNSVARLAGLESALSHIFESRAAFFRAAGPFLGLFVLSIGYGVMNGWQYLPAAPAGVRASIFIGTLYGPLMIGGVGIAVWAALWVGRRNYRRRVRSHLFARAPREGGQPARCRACDGALPDRRDAFVRCAFCSTENLVTPELQDNRQELLSRESQFYSDRANRAVADASAGGVHMDRIFWASLVVVYGAVIGLGYLSQALLPGH